MKLLLVGLLILWQVQSFFAFSGGHLNPVRSKSVRVSATISPPIISTRVQKIKDISLQKDILRDITNSEFALKLEVKGGTNQATQIDYERLMAKLDQHLVSLKARENSADLPMIERIEGTLKNLTILASTKEKIASNNINALPPMQVMSKADQAPSPASAADSDPLRELRESFRVIVREDGTVDWDGASAAGKEVAKFGAELWERINGKEETEGVPSISELLGQATVKEPVTDEIIALRATVATATDRLQRTVKYRDDIKSKLRRDRRDGRSLSQEDLQSLKRLDVRVKELDKRVRLFTLDLDVERICAYLKQELESSVEPADQRIFIAEAALVEKQLFSMVSGLKLDLESASRAMGLSPSPISAILSTSTTTSTSTSTVENEGVFDPAVDDKTVDIVSLVDDDELALVNKAVTDLKNRLGLDTQIGPQMDWGTLGVLVKDTTAKISVGLSFFGQGFKVLTSDLQYAWVLFLKAIQGYTLKAREVNAIRRTGKDLLTLIPFTIILIIPLSPIGHVLVFSFIQRFFPDFFPSPFTEKRLNLMRLYSEIERKNDDDILGGDSHWDWSWSSWSTPIAESMEKFKLPELPEEILTPLHKLVSTASSAITGGVTSTSASASASSTDTERNKGNEDHHTDSRRGKK